jgi:hypothetical protein
LLDWTGKRLFGAQGLAHGYPQTHGKGITDDHDFFAV